MNDIERTTPMRAAMTRIRFKGAAVAAASVAMVAVLTACGGDGGSDKPEGKTKQPPASSSETNDAPVPDEGDESQVVATMQNAEGIKVVINAVERDSGGYVTVKGVVQNDSSKRFLAQGWQGSEQELRDNGASVAGASLVDQTGKKRYLVLRDTDGRCLCTQFVTGIAAGEKASFFAQFPAPPQTTTEVEFQIPTMPTATITISG